MSNISVDQILDKFNVPGSISNPREDVGSTPLSTQERVRWLGWERDGLAERLNEIALKGNQMIDQTATEISLSVATTEALEQELKDRSEALSRHQARFAQVRDELKRRRETKDEQPPMQVTTVESQQKADADLSRTLALKITEMEGQQAKLVVEAEVAKAAQREAEERLALVVKRLPQKREPMTREAARELALRHVGDNPFGTPGYNVDWVIDVIVEASR